MSPKAPAPEVLQRLAAITGPAHCLTALQDQAPYLSEWRGRWTGKAAAVLRPGSTAEVSAIMRLAHEERIAVVPQGGNTGLVGGQIPGSTGHEIVIVTTRLNRLRACDPAGNTICVEAGMTLQCVQELAAEVDRLFPLSLAAEGSATIGGNLATNAGGTSVIAYGTARALCLGLEAVLPDGSIFHGLSGLRKDNTGYDLKQLLIGAEGTLGLITAATLKLFPRPRTRDVVFVGLASPGAALRLLAHLRAAAPGEVTAFEFMPRFGLELVLRHIPGARDPLAASHDWYVLAEVSSSGDGATAALEDALGDALCGGLVADAVRAETGAAAAALWDLRHAMSEAQKCEGPSLKHDVAVAVKDVPRFLEAAGAAALRVAPGARLCAFGHLGDGNVHFNVSAPAGRAQGFEALRAPMEDAVFAEVLRLGGSISAEHGIGVAKRDWLARTKDETQLAAMRAVKAALDPRGLMNPGKLL